MSEITNADPRCWRCGQPRNSHIGEPYVCPNAVFEAEPAPEEVTPDDAPSLIDAVTCKGCGWQFPRAVTVYSAWLNSYFCHACHVNRFVTPEPAPEPMPPADWRRCPGCGLVWPHPSCRSGMYCPSCRMGNVRRESEGEIASLQRRNKDMEACLRCERDFKEMAMAEARLLSDENALLRRQGAPQEPASEPMPPVDWRRCPACGQAWPHPSDTVEPRCWRCQTGTLREYFQREVARLVRQVEELKEHAMKGDVQSAACLTAAEGGTDIRAKRGEYGWSVAYEKVLALRRQVDAARGLTKEKGFFTPDFIAATMDAAAREPEAKPLSDSIVAELWSGKGLATEAGHEPAWVPFIPTASPEVVRPWFDPNFLRSYPFKVFMDDATVDAYAASNP